MSLNLEENPPLNLDDDERTYITKAEFIAGVINSVKNKYPHLRQDSKAP